VSGRSTLDVGLLQLVAQLGGSRRLNRVAGLSLRSATRRQDRHHGSSLRAASIGRCPSGASMPRARGLTLELGAWVPSTS
jgi:hypothetical protein